jgi:hypothetical protein
MKARELTLSASKFQWQKRENPAKIHQRKYEEQLFIPEQCLVPRDRRAMLIG